MRMKVREHVDSCTEAEQVAVVERQRRELRAGRGKVRHKWFGRKLATQYESPFGTFLDPQPSRLPTVSMSNSLPADFSHLTSGRVAR